MNLYDPKDLKKELLNLLHEHQIPEFDITVKDYKKNPKENLGCYKSMSQFRARPIICIDTELHKKTLLEMDDFDDEKFKGSVLDTLGHEYGHVIEEFIRVDALRQQDKTYLKKLNANFNDMEDFAELFGNWLTGSGYLSGDQESTIRELVNYYVESTYPKEIIAWVQQDKWKRELDYFLLHNEKSFEKYQTMEGSFNKCRQVSEALGERLANVLDVKILRLQGYQDSIDEAHPKWQKIGKNHIVHYVVLLEDQWVIDMTAKQFNPKNPARLIMDKKDLAWSEVEVFHDYCAKKNKSLKMR